MKYRISCSNEWPPHLAVLDEQGHEFLTHPLNSTEKVLAEIILKLDKEVEVLKVQVEQLRKELNDVKEIEKKQTKTS
jgi:hypothetical protein